MENVLFKKKLHLNTYSYVFILHSDVMGFHFQQIHLCASVGKGVCITMIGTDRNCIAYTIIQL